MRRTALTMLIATLVGVSTGCGILGPEEPAPDGGASSGAPAPTTPSEDSEPSDGVVPVDTAWAGTQLHLAVHPIETDGDHAVLRYDITATPDDPSGSPMWSTLALSFGGLGNSVTDGRGVRLFDTGAGLVHPVAQTDDGGPAATIERGDGDGATLTGTGTAVFAAPEGDTADVLFPRFGAALDVPVIDAGESFADAADLVGGVDDAETRRLRAFTRSYDEESSTSAEEDRVTVTLASDVLFDPDEHTLSKKARAVVDRAATSITNQADSGDVHVVGHTDDVDSDAYNQQLSERRAASVADRLEAALGHEYTITEEGRGESEPVAEGTSTEARAANRRVEIEFQGHLVVEHDAGGLPETDAPTVDNGPVTMTSLGGEYAVEVTSMVRRPGAIVGTLTAERTSGDSTDPAWFLPANNKVVGDRKFGTAAEASGAHNLALLGASERVLPFDYEARGVIEDFPLRRLLGSEEIPTLDTGRSTRITVVWPDTGQDTVTVDAPDRFRITGIPVTEGTGD
ncbi:OmpA family protein [Myceligenerans pegani]|uniref:OmpA family protein n=1 Tax=Myceligenerans pegani TaxID=2776917 RepID=A0ABR9N4I2_9MICO|nr:OmpA family protein [Myceligenerans sp. TRM 65318]MBE1878580.1 OmpA family protein [Myceligenerans sp. TRM 65318]MBE3020851.1 OmpA family protein [Myceligenerans sp. TRM 65318]